MSATSPVWPDLAESHPLRLLHTELAPLLSEEPPHKIWGITLSPDLDHFHTKIILQKFLRANKGVKEPAKKQLEETLQWRRGYFDENGKVIGTWDESKFKDLGYITKEIAKDGPGGEKEVIVTWNIYGNVKDFTKTFGDVEEFLRWRVDLMERSIDLLDLASAKQPIPDHDATKPTVDPYQAIQIHDYLQISFFRTPAEVRIASKKTIELFQKYYPELLDKKFFVNVPVIMGWVYSAMKMLIARETFKKLTMLSYGSELAKGMESETIPVVYGGKGEPLEKAAISFGGAGQEGHVVGEGGSEAAPENAPTPTAEAAPQESTTPEPAPETSVGEIKVVEDETSTSTPTAAPTTTIDPVVSADVTPAADELEKK